MDPLSAAVLGFVAANSLVVPSLANAAEGVAKWSARVARAAFGYDAVDSEGKRQRPTGLVRSEDAELLPDKRRLLISQSRDLARNFSVAGWMVRRHLDYVTTFSFQARLPDNDLNEKIEAKLRWWSEPENCDVAGRFSFPAMIRMAEQRAVFDGDIGLLKLRDGRLQAIEGDRIRTPYGFLDSSAAVQSAIPPNIVHGVVTDVAGKALQYCVCRRGPASDFAPQGASMTFERMVSAKNLYLHGYYERFDQVRGIPPIAPAVNALVDLYEGLDYALCRMKVEQLLGLVVTSEEQPVAVNEGQQDYTKIKLGKKPFVLQLDPHEDAKFLSSTNPSTQVQQFCALMIQLVLKSLDIPYSFFSEDFTTYSGARQALLQYELAASIKRQSILQMLNHLTRWRLQMFIDDGELPSFPLNDRSFEWVPVGLSWIDPLKEIQGYLAALSAGLESRTDILKQQGRDIRDVAAKLAAEKELFEKLGIPVAINPQNGLLGEMVNAIAA